MVLAVGAMENEKIKSGWARIAEAIEGHFELGARRALIGV